MKKEIRIVGLSDSIGMIWVQTKIKGEWEQERITISEFEEMVSRDFPQYVEEFRASGKEDMADWFYSYGEGGEETYVFRG